MHDMFKGATYFNEDVSLWNILKVVDGTLGSMFYESGFDRTTCGSKWKELNTFSFENGRSGCCNKGSYMSDPHKNPFSAVDGAGSCDKCPVNTLGSIHPNSDVACVPIKDLVKQWCDDETTTQVETKYGHIRDWDVANIKTMQGLFSNRNTFNSDISKVSDIFSKS